ncbi:hypothetical protein NOCARDAX2BIS_430028 [Nocardioides sp. AX2bis]|nr:hypothetical protein NOCARDAX2BIS_430028 [Nocardioides sp. AX2bis]
MDEPVENGVSLGITRAGLWAIRIYL